MKSKQIVFQPLVNWRQSCVRTEMPEVGTTNNNLTVTRISTGGHKTQDLTPYIQIVLLTKFVPPFPVKSQFPYNTCMKSFSITDSYFN